MADAYGTTVLTYSKDIDCDFNKLTELLNEFQWSSSGEQWTLQKHENKCYVFMGDGWTYQTQYPTVFPTEETGVIVLDEDENEIIKTEPTEDDYDNAYDFVIEDVSLEKLTKTLLPTIKKGWIELACVSNEKLRYISMGKLRINADGSSSRSLVTVGMGYDGDFSEEYKN